MKTTLDLSDALFDAAKERAKTRHTTLRALVEEGLRRVLADEATSTKKPFRLSDARVHGRGQISEPAQWRLVEEDHINARITRS